jgi:hypothetical protein
MHFDGPVAKSEEPRLKKQNEVIRDILLGGDWFTLGELERITGFPSPSISAHLRHLRKPRFGSYNVEKRRVDGLSTGLWEYHLNAPAKLQAAA